MGFQYPNHGLNITVPSSMNETLRAKCDLRRDNRMNQFYSIRRT